MTSVEGIVMGDQTVQDMMHRLSSVRLMEDEGPLVFCNLPSRPSVSDWEASRMSYYNGNERFAVPFKWEAAPGKPIVDESSQAESADQSPLQLRPPPSASNSPLHPLQPLSLREQHRARLPPKSRTCSRPELGVSTSSSSRSSGSTTTVDSSSSSSSIGGLYRMTRDKGSTSRRSEFDWPEVSDDESSTTRTTDDQELQSTTATGTAKQWSFSSSSFSSTSSQSPSPVTSRGDGGSRVGGGGAANAKDLFLRRNVGNFVAASAASPINYRDPSGAGRSSTEGSEDAHVIEEIDDHVRPGGFLGCMPIFSKGMRMFHSQLSEQLTSSDRRVPAMINCSQRLTPGIKNRGYRQSL